MANAVLEVEGQELHVNKEVGKLRYSTALRYACNFTLRLTFISYLVISYSWVMLSKHCDDSLQIACCLNTHSYWASLPLTSVCVLWLVGVVGYDFKYFEVKISSNLPQILYAAKKVCYIHLECTGCWGL